MLIEQISNPLVNNDHLKLLKNQCSDFLTEADGRCLYKSLPTRHDDFQKIKVRLRKKNTKISETFNQAFSSKLNHFHQRAIFASGSLTECPADEESFYIFPINKYKFMYNSEIVNSTSAYKHSFETIFEQFGDDEGHQIINDLLTYTYTSTNLTEGLDKKAEIIIFNIPYYYAIRESTVIYEDLLTLLVN